MSPRATDNSTKIAAWFINWREREMVAKRTKSEHFGTFEGKPIFLTEDTMKRILGLLAVFGTLTVLQPDGNVKFYATFPMGGTQMSVLELDTGRTWMIRASDERGNAGNVIDYDNGGIYQWNTTDGCRRCGGSQRWEE
jgi:hypothetical protein